MQAAIMDAAMIPHSLHEERTNKCLLRHSLERLIIVPRREGFVLRKQQIYHNGLHSSMGL